MCKKPKLSFADIEIAGRRQGNEDLPKIDKLLDWEVEVDFPKKTDK